MLFICNLDLICPWYFVYLSTCVARYGKALTTDPVFMRSSPATGHIRCGLFANQPK